MGYAKEQKYQPTTSILAQAAAVTPHKATCELASASTYILKSARIKKNFFFNAK